MTLYENWIAYYTIIRSGILRVCRLWPQTLVPPILTSFLYFSIFGHILGSHLGTFHGVPYVSFIAPGLIMMQIVSSAYSGTVSSFFMAKFQRNIEELLVSPLSNFTIVFGYISLGVVRGILTGLLVLGVSSFFMPLHFHSIGVTLLVAILAALVLSLGAIINAIYAKKFDDIAIIPNFVLTPLTYFGGVFYSINHLPHVWRRLSYFNPLYYMIHVFRYGFLGIYSQHLILSISIVFGFFLVLLTATTMILRSGAGLRT